MKNTKDKKDNDKPKIDQEKDDFPQINLNGREISAAILKEIPEEAAVFYRFVPIEKKDDVLSVGMLDPNDLKAREALRFLSQRGGFKAEIFSIDQAGLDNILKQYQSLRGEVKKALKELEEELSAEEGNLGKEEAEELSGRVAVEAPITKIVAVILKHATEGKASDIHIEPVENEVRVRFRVDGILYTSIVLPKEIQSAVVSRVKILSNLKIDETRIPQDGRFHTMTGSKKIDFRVSTFPTASGEKVVLRVLDPTVGLQDFVGLGLAGYNLRTLEEAIKQPFGMILITGPTGSGKTTTLYSILNRLNEEAVNIVSLEDPVEYFVQGVNQSQIRPEIGYTFASGLRHILRQDPDVIMVGEIRDEETASLAIHAALTGHIVLSTLHTNNAIGVIPRLVDMKVSEFLLPAALNLAIAQRLVRRLCPHCKKEIPAPPQVEEIIEKELSGMSESRRKEIAFTKPFKVYQPVGCKLCGNKGTKGRIAIYEMLKMTPELMKLLNDKSTNELQMQEEANRQEMATMKQDGILKVLQGLVSFEEMVGKVEDEG